jgi:hypothetical protein
MDTKSFPENVRSLIADVTETARQNQIQIVYGKGKRIRAGTKSFVAGYFDDSNRILTAATNHSLYDWLEVFVHESCHMDQWITQCKYWTAELDHCYNTFDRFISGKTEPDIEYAIDQIVMLEADCERRSLRKIAQYELPVDPARYSQKANAYLLSHKAMWHYQSWYRTGPFRNKSLVRSMPNQIGAPYTYQMKYNRTDPEIFAHCFKQA